MASNEYSKYDLLLYFDRSESWVYIAIGARFPPFIGSTTRHETCRSTDLV